MSDSEIQSKTVVVVGAGGNIGSHLVPHLGRMPSIGRVRLIDKDTYEARNLQTQNVTPKDVGKPKAKMQAAVLHGINPALHVEALTDAVERIPLGKLRGDVILSCLDSRIARQHVNQFAWRLGVPLVDAGVEAAGLLARVNVYVPGRDNPCLECAWDDRDYDALEQTYPCGGGVSAVAPTNSPSSLGGLAAALQAIECEKLLSGDENRAAVNRQVLVDGLHHKHYVTAYRRNPRCRFSDHLTWKIHRLRRSPHGLSLEEALQLGSSPASNDAVTAFRVEGKPFVKRLVCSACGHARAVLRLQCSLRVSQTMCRICGNQMVAAGFDLTERLEAASVDRDALKHTVGRLGLRPGEIFSVSHGTLESHYELVGEDG